MTRTDASAPSTPENGVQIAVAEHRSIVALLQRLGPAEELAELRDIVEGLSRLLPKHFAGEEAPDGLFDELLQIEPALSSRVRRLITDHGALREQLGGLLELIGGLEVATRRMNTVKVAFIEHLTAHEAMERELVVDAYETDIGGSD